jgi:hypothetical protein
VISLVEEAGECDWPLALLREKIQLGFSRHG